MKPYNVTLCVYADNEQEIQDLQTELNEFIKTKYNQGIYPRATTLTRFIRQYGNSAMVNAALKR